MDGQQRITSLFAVKKGLIISKDGKEIDYKDISIDLSYDPDDEEQVIITEPDDSIDSISVYKLLNGSLTDFLEQYSKDDIKKIETYQKRLTTYDFSTILINEYPIDIACRNIYQNQHWGIDSLCLKLWLQNTIRDKNFDLSVEYDLLIDDPDSDNDLHFAGYDTIPSSTMLQCIAAGLITDITRKVS